MCDDLFGRGTGYCVAVIGSDLFSPDFARRGDIAGDHIGELVEATLLNDRPPLFRQINRGEGLVGAIHLGSIALVVITRLDGMDEPELALRFLLRGPADRFGIRIAPALDGLARRVFEFAVEGIDAALEILRDEAISQMGLAVGGVSTPAVLGL